MMGVEQYQQVATEPIPTGTSPSACSSTPTDRALSRRNSVALRQRPAVGEGRLENTVFFRFSGYSGMDVGRDNGIIVDRAYADKAPYPFTGTVKKVIFDLKPAAAARTSKLSTRPQPTAQRRTASAPNRPLSTPSDDVTIDSIR